jgi:ABC-type dipeptide/oligopeptide/nickel transport system ATPase subunit
MSKTITELTKALEHYRQREREKQRRMEEAEKNKSKETFTQQELHHGEKFLRDKNLMDKTESHIKNIGLVGEEEKGMLLFFILLTRMFKEPLHALVQGKSGSGKTYLLKKIASLVPKSHIRITTALTENTLYHSLKNFWKHMILLIEDLDGAFTALLPLREMMSNQSISKLSTEKDMKTGEFKQMMLYVEGPVCVAGATTKDRIFEDNANRSFLIQVNETNEHQERVLDYQRKDIAGLLDKRKEQQTQIILKTAQLHLEPLEVVIPFGEELRIPDYVFKKLRTNAHYLTLIKAITFWHQKQREIKQKADGTRFIEATLEDVSRANKLSKEVLLRKSDELNGGLRGFFEDIKVWLKANNRESFYAKPLREKLRMNPMQVNRYLKELDQRGYLKQAGGNRKTGYEYTVEVWDDYEQLKSGINILDEVLESLKAVNKSVKLEMIEV